MTRVAMMLGAVLLAASGASAEFRVDAADSGAVIIRRPCDGGPCCNTCHVGQPPPDKKPPKHDPALYGKYVVQLPEGRRLRISNDAYVAREKGDLILYEGKTRTVLPRSALILQDSGGRSAVVLTEGVTGTK